MLKNIFVIEKKNLGKCQAFDYGMIYIHTKNEFTIYD